ncbi:Copia protein [Sesamum angolense]|uniref:Copia protein n=1 Tax=Sesamum angolense TaxID=2727404 RepID=A0AAE1WDK1_9LAMI|nr:Copia protein [Sesamum angolense]
MENANTATVLGKGNVEVQFTSGKKLSLTNVLHVPEIRKNLVSAAILSKKGLKTVIEADKLIVTKNGEFVGKGYYCDGMFKLYPEMNNKRTLIDTPTELRRSQRPRKAKKLDPDFLYFIVEGDRNIVLNKIPVLLKVNKTFTEAMTSRDVTFWKEAVNDEMDSLLANNTWVLTDLPPGSKAIGCKWIFRRKYNTDGSIQTFKARLVAKGFTQKEDQTLPLLFADYLGLQVILVLNIGKALEESLDISKELRIWDSFIIDIQ